MNEKELLTFARNVVDLQVESVFYDLLRLAGDNDLEFDWVVKEFRNKFNKRVREYEDTGE